MEKEKKFLLEKEGKNRRSNLASFCLSVIAAAALFSGSDRHDNQHEPQGDFNLETARVLILSDSKQPDSLAELKLEQGNADTASDFNRTPILNSMSEVERKYMEDAGENDRQNFQAPKLQHSSKENINPTGVVADETPNDGLTNKSNEEVIKGFATYYGIDDGYGLENTLGCTGEPFDPYDPTTAARPLSSPFNCGDKVEVCNNDSCIEVVIKDACPGCDSLGIVIDLSYGAMHKLSPEEGRTSVTLKKID